MEKESFEKIRQLLEVSKRERHYKVLLTLKNLADVRRNPACYNLPVIPRPLPSEVVVGEHFVNVDLLCLISGGASTSGGCGDRNSGSEISGSVPVKVVYL